MSHVKSTLSPPDSIAPTSPFSTHSANLSNSSLSAIHSLTSPDTTSPILITQATYKKPTTKHVTQLTTSSAAGIAVANQVTPQRLASLLLVTGPLAIRHITSNLSIQVSGFEKLSLSKQRRLIMNCLNQGFEEGSIVFQKIGWGQWTAKKVKPEEFITERDALRISNAKVKDDETNSASTGSTGTAVGGGNGKSIHVAAANARRGSITKNRYEADHHNKLLNRRRGSIAALLSKSHPTSQVSVAASSAAINDFAILSDDEDEDAIALSTSDFDDDDSESELSSDLSHSHPRHHDSQVFKLDEEEERIPSLKLSSRTHNISPNSTSNAASRRSSFNNRSNGISKPKFVKNRANSMTPTTPELRYYTTAAAASNATYHSNSSHPNLSTSANTAKPEIPKTSHSTINSRRHSSIRSTLSTDNDPSSAVVDDDTDEEDWESIGAIELLRNLKNGNVSNNVVNSSSHIYVTRKEQSPPVVSSGPYWMMQNQKGRDEEEDAASALLNLTRSVHSTGAAI